MRAGRSFAADSTLTFVFNALMLAANLLTGVVVARALGTHGRGELAAVQILPQILGWVFAMGCAQAVSYRLARSPEQGPSLFVSWIVMLGVLAMVAIVAGEALLPTLFHAQTAAARAAARIYLLMIAMVLLTELLNGMLLGSQDVLFYNLTRVGYSAGVAATYLVLVALGEFSVDIALIASACVSGAVAAATLARVIRRIGLGRPSPELGRSTLWYGARAHGTTVGGIVNQRLDLFIIPAFLSASSIGLYSVATNVSWIVVTIAGAISVIVLPAAARRDRDAGNRLVIASLHVTLLLGATMAIAIGVAADVLLPLIYGSGFDGSALPLRLLLPGAVLYAGAGILWSGLYASNRPFTAVLTQVPGLVVTVAGLLIFLPSYGIDAAAIISTVAYTLVFLTALLLYRRAAAIPWSAFRLDRGQLLSVASRMRPRRVRSEAGARVSSEVRS
jgi:O-antigen/teichoic acid export membrane protein